MGPKKKFSFPIFKKQSDNESQSSVKSSGKRKPAIDLDKIGNDLNKALGNFKHCIRISL